MESVAPANEEQIVAALRDALAEFERPGDGVVADASTWIVSATAS